MKKMRKAKKAKKIKTQSLMSAAPRKRGRPKKVAGLPQETKRDKMQKIAKLGKRKYAKAIEDMATKKISKNLTRRKGSFSGNHETISETVSVREPNYRAGNIIAGPDVAPVGVKKKPVEHAAAEKKKKDKNLPKAELNRYIKTLKSRGRNPKNIKVLENKEKYFTIEFSDAGEVITASHAKGWDI